MVKQKQGSWSAVCLLVWMVILTACELPLAANPGPRAAGGEPFTPTLAAVAVPTTISPSLVPPTPLPPLPTAPPTPVIQPTATDNPALADWTVLVYMAADNNLSAAARRDLAEMVAAGGATGQVNVLVQLDQGEGLPAVRYHLSGSDPTASNAEPVQELGEVNMGEAAVLTDFLTWGITSYPANRVAVILWDHGAGWNGLAFDDTTAFPGAGDHLTLAELTLAFAQALAQTRLDLFDVVAFDACLMGQLDVFQALQPHARYAVASEELTPGQGWDYSVLLRRLYADPDMDGALLARQMAADFLDSYTRAEPDDFVTMAAVDLAQLPPLIHAVETLAAALMTDPAFVAGAVGDARSGAEAFARVYGEAFDQYAAVDLRHFAAILAQRSPDERVTAAAQAVIAALEAAVIANERGAGFKNSGGIAVYFPRTASFYNPAYGQSGRLPNWNAFLNSYHAAGLDAISPPQLNLIHVLRDTIHVQQPAYLEYEIIGRDIQAVALVGGRFETDESGQTHRRLLEYDALIPEPTYLPDGSRLHEWRDGVHHDFFVWDTRVTYLTDAAGNGDFVVMWPAEAAHESDSTLFTVRGRYRPAAAEQYTDASLVFNHRTGQLARVWGTEATSSAPAEITPQPGDEFQLTHFYLGDGDQVTEAPGPSLFFDENGRLSYDWRPLPDGDYFLGFQAQTVAGQTAAAFTPLTVNNSAAVPGYHAYLDPYLGFQFLYPENWYTPVYSGSLLYTSSLDSATQVQITHYPHLDRQMDATALKSIALRSFGPVDLLHEESITVAGGRALRTAYGYNREGDGPRTGIFLAFVRDGAGFIVDVDGPLAAEAATIAAVDALAATWQFVPAGIGVQPGQWTKLDLAAFSVARPADFTYQEYNGWQRFVANRDTFVALRAQPATISAAEALAALVRDAGTGVSGFTANDTYRFALGGPVPWQRTDFSYVSSEGTEIWGFIMVKVEDGREVVAWAEAPRPVYNDLEQAVFLVMIADMSLRP